MTSVAHVDIVITLKIRKECVIPHGTIPVSEVSQYPAQHSLTMPEIFQVKKLVVPLCDDSNGIFDKSYHDEEASYGGEISVLMIRIPSSDLCRRQYGQGLLTVSMAPLVYLDNPLSCSSVV